MTQNLVVNSSLEFDRYILFIFNYNKKLKYVVVS